MSGMMHIPQGLDRFANMLTRPCIGFLALPGFHSCRPAAQGSHEWSVEATTGAFNGSSAASLAGYPARPETRAESCNVEHLPNHM